MQKNIELPYQDSDSEPDSTLTHIKEQARKDLSFAKQYREGKATDSFGNDVFSRNVYCPESGLQTLVKKTNAELRTPANIETQCHMDSRLIGQAGAPANDSELNKGLDEITLRGMRATFARQVGTPSMAQQVRKMFNDRALINSAFPRKGKL
jgi:hypothetical protein